MKRTALPRTGAAVTALVLSLAAVAGCGSGGADDAEGSGGKESATAKAASAAELEKLVLADGDVEGYTVDEGEGYASFAASKDDVEVGDEKCAPLAYVLSSLPLGDPAAHVRRLATEKTPATTPSKDIEDMTDAEMEEALASSAGAATSVSLSSYDGEGAAEAMDSLSDAVGACAGGFTGGMAGESAKFTKVAPAKDAGQGDESVAFTLGLDMEGKPTSVSGEAVRNGGTVTTYYTFDLETLMSGKPSGIPAEVVKAQSAKLG